MCSPVVKTAKTANPAQFGGIGGIGGFSGDSMIEIPRGDSTRVDQIKPGDRVASSAGTSTVLAVIKLRSTQGKAIMRKFSCGLLIDPWHPLRDEAKQWALAKDNPDGKIVCYECKFTYNLVLDSGHTIYINGSEAATLGHEFTGESVYHPYFGTDRIIIDLKKCYGWSVNTIYRIITLRHNGFVRNPYGIVVGMKPTAEV